MRLVLLFILLLPLSAAGEEVPVLDLSQAVGRALRSSHLLRQARATIEERDAAVEEALAAGRPQIDLQAMGNYTTPIPTLLLGGRSLDLGSEWNYQVTAMLRQTVTDFGRTHYRVKASEFAKLAAEAQLEETRRVVALAVSRAFYKTLSDGVRVGVAAGDVEARRELLRVSEAKVKEGAAARYDLFRSRSALAEAEAELRNLQTEHQKSLELLWSLTGLEFTPVTPALSPLPDPRDESPESALQRPDLLRLRTLLEQQQSLTRAAATDNRPRLSLQSQYTRQNPVGFQLDQRWLTALQLEIPLFDGGATRARVRQGEARESQLEAQLGEAERKVRLEVENSYLDFLMRSRELEPAQTQLEEAEEAYRLSRLRYEVGLSTLVELLETRTELTRAQTRVRTAELALQLAWLEWAAAADQLFPVLDSLSKEEEWS